MKPCTSSAGEACLESQPFTEAAYAGQREGSLRSAAQVVPLVCDLIGPRSVVDIGCGTGTWLSAFKKNGVQQILGADGSYVDPEWLQISEGEFLALDLSRPFRIDRKFDLAVSLEVAEHIPSSAADGFIRSLCELAPAILFSAAIPGQGGYAHLNEQWPQYWARLFEVHGFAPFDCLRRTLWNNEEVEWWYRQNVLLFVRRDAIQKYPGLKNELALSEVPGLVHPRLFEQISFVADTRNWSVRQGLRAASQILKRAILKRSRVGRR